MVNSSSCFHRNGDRRLADWPFQTILSRFLSYTRVRINGRDRSAPRRCPHRKMTDPQLFFTSRTPWAGGGYKRWILCGPFSLDFCTHPPSRPARLARATRRLSAARVRVVFAPITHPRSFNLHIVESTLRRSQERRHARTSHLKVHRALPGADPRRRPSSAKVLARAAVCASAHLLPRAVPRCLQQLGTLFCYPLVGYLARDV